MLSLISTSMPIIETTFNADSVSQSRSNMDAFLCASLDFSRHLQKQVFMRGEQAVWGGCHHRVVVGRLRVRLFFGMGMLYLPHLSSFFCVAISLWLRRAPNWNPKGMPKWLKPTMACAFAPGTSANRPEMRHSNHRLL
jgi:hypothetical protein